MNYVIGVDIGTQGTKAIIIDKNGKVLSHSYKGYDVETPKPSWAQQWPEPWNDAVFETIKTVVTDSGVDPKSIKGVAVSGLYGGSGIPVDKNMKPLAPCLIWMDRRAEKEVQWVKENINLNKLFEITGNSVNSYFGFTKMLWIKNNLNIWDKINYFIPPACYSVYKLTGEIAVDLSSAGNIGGIFDIKNKVWSQEMLEKLDIPRSFLPDRLVDCTEIVGGVTVEASKLTGLAEGTPVICGGVDAPVATFGAGALTDGNHVAMMGTSMCWGFVTEEANLSEELVSMPHVLNSKEKIYTFGGAATAGASVRWFRDVLGIEEKLAEQITGINAYSLLEMKTKNISAGSDGLLVLPYFMGERSPIWDSNARATFTGLSLVHTKAHMYKALMEGVAFSLRHNMEMVDDKRIRLDEEVILVGGVSKSMVWPQIISDVLNRPVKIIKNDVEATLGDAILAGIATGLFENASIVKEWLEYDTLFVPNKENAKKYNDLFESYKKLYLNTKEIMSELTN